MFYFCSNYAYGGREKVYRVLGNSPIRRKKLLKQVGIGLPLAVTIVAAIFINFFSGWYKRADMELRTNSSLIIVVVIAIVLIAGFISVFSAKHQWEMNEQRYKEFLSKKDRP